MIQESALAPLLIFILGAFPLLAFAYAIGVKKKYHLIAGWKESGMKENPVLASKIGISLLFGGLAITAGSIVSYFGIISHGWLAVICVVAVLYSVVRSIYVSVKLSGKNT
ncbi:hypothetical protein [Microbulbifer agarilyticus]